MLEPALIRKAIREDIGDVKSCAEEAYAEYVAAIGKKPAPMITDFASCIRNDRVNVTSDAAHRVAGFCIFYQRDNHMFLENVAVRNVSRGQGLGKALVAYCEAQARHLGLAQVELYTNEKMTANLSIYPHLGYEETARRQENGFNRVYFRKVLE